MLSENEEGVVVDEFYGEDGVPALEDWFEEEFLLFEGGLIEMTFLNDELSSISE